MNPPPAPRKRRTRSMSVGVDELQPRNLTTEFMEYAASSSDKKHKPSLNMQYSDVSNTKNEMTVGALTVQTLLSRLTTWKPPVVIGRESEFDTIRQFLLRGLSNASGSCLYVCGSPGTGKSLSVHKICDQYETSTHHVFVRLNAMSFSSPVDVFPAVIKQLKERKVVLPHRFSIEGKTSNELGDDLTRLFLCSRVSDEDERMKLFHKKIVLVIDEIDNIQYRNTKKVIYRLMEWAQKDHSRLVLIGIANSVDLTERMRIFRQKPQVLIFPAYNQTQLLSILKQRVFNIHVPLTKQHLDSMNNDGIIHGDTIIASIFDSRALELCARRLASKSGDVRACLDICKNCLEGIENELLLLERKDIEDISDKAILNNKYMIHCSLMGKKLHERFGSHAVEAINALPTTQKTLLVALTMVTSRIPENSLLGIDTFRRYCAFLQNKLSMPNITCEFREIVEELVGAGMVSLVNKSGKRAGGQSNASVLLLKVNYDDVVYAFGEDEYFGPLLARAQHIKWKKNTPTT